MKPNARIGTIFVLAFGFIVFFLVGLLGSVR